MGNKELFPTQDYLVKRRKWRPISEYKGGHALFWCLNPATLYGYFICSGHLDDKGNICNDFYQDLDGLGEVHYFQYYNEKWDHQYE
jgi:hypothetical protein